MLSVSNVKSAAKGSVYYFEEDNYYFQGEQSTVWYGAGAESLGLEGAVDPATFKAVLEGKLPDGSDLTHMVGSENKHRPGYDLTFSAPKSVSILALVYGDQSVLEAHKWATEKALNEVEKLASTRKYSDGQTVYEQTGNLVIAQFLHDTNRNSEPHLHTHAVVANATLSGDGWKTLSSDTKNGRGFTDTVWNQQVSIGAIYRRYLRGKLEQDGHIIEEKGSRGEWDIVGIPVEPLSTRRKEILEQAGPDASEKSKSVAALDTRKEKDFSDIESVREGWRETMREAGFDHTTYEQARGERKGQLDSAYSMDSADTPKNGLSVVVDAAIEQVSRKSVRFTFDSVLTNVLNQIPVRDGVLEQAKQALDIAIEKGALIAVDKNQTLFTSAIHIRDEQRLSQLAGRMAERRSGLVAAVDARDITAKVADRDRGLTLIDARGGTDFQRDLLGKLVGLAEENNKTPVVIASTVKEKKALSSHTSTLVLTPEEVGEYAEKSRLPEKPVFIVSEAERINVPTLYGILQTADKADASTVVIDTHTRRTTGFASEVLRTAGVPVLTTTPGTEKGSLTLVQKDTVDDRMQVAARYVSQQKAAGFHVVAQAGNERTRGQLTREIRAALQENGLIGEKVTTVTALSQVWLDSDNRRLRSTYQPGMVLERTEGKEIHERFTITGVNKDSHTLRVTDQKGQNRGLRISSIDGDYRLFKPRELQLNEGEQVKSTGDINGKGRAGEILRVAGIQRGNWLFREKLILEKSDGKTVKVRTDQPLKLDYGYTEGLGASRNTEGHVVAVLSGREVTDSTVNLLRRSGENIIAFTPLDDAAITARLENERTSVSVTQGIKSLAGKDDLTQALRELQNNRLAPKERAVRLAIDQVVGKDVTFSSLQVINEAMKIDKSLAPDVASAELARLERRGEIVPLDGTQGRLGDYVQRENWQSEVSILRHILEGKNSVEPLMPDAAARLKDKMEGLTSGQQKAAQMILESSDRFTSIQGSAGVGKTTQYRVIAAAVEQLDSGVQIKGLAPTHRAVSELQSAGIPAQTIASFISEQSQRQVTGEVTDFTRTLFVVDEGSMPGNRDLSEVTNIIATGNGRAVYSGDRKQLKPLESGAPFSLILDRSAADVAIMKEIVRQTPELRPAVEAIIAGDVNTAIELADKVAPGVVPREQDAWLPENSIVDLKDKQQSPVSLIADDFIGRTADAREKTLIVAELNADRRNINSAIHERLQERGVLGDSVTVQQLVRISNSMADLGHQGFWENNVGNVVRIGEEYLQVAGTDTRSSLVELQEDSGSSRWLSPLELRTSNVAIFTREEVEISVGDRLRLTSTDRDRMLKTNDLAVVTDVDSNGKVTIESDGRQVTLNPRQNPADQHFDYGYAVTTYSSQGASIEYVIALVGTEGARQRMAALDSTYVALSRAKEHVQVYADDLKDWIAEVTSDTGERQTVHDVLLRNDDVKASREVALWERSHAVADTRLNGKVDQTLTEAAHFSGGKTPELLYAVLNEHGRHRGNWHVPVSPTTGRLDIDSAYYEGARDGLMIVVQQGEQEGKPMQAASMAEAIVMMTEHPEQAVTILRVDAAAVVDTAKQDNSVDADTANLSMETQLEQERLKEQIASEKEDDSTDFRSERESDGGDIERDEEKLLRDTGRDIELENYYADDVEDPRNREMMNDEINIMRKEPTPENELELVKNLEKTME
ncbi:MobF family relaxase [Serratia sp. UGAL515B_01]|uniref:MobF family relaxase n=1 Tax=Serratia sp. UGAL515B_01 TaxID=2986763 RepID=UPI002954D804|nr:MobF family relaxase [Serratia sp. UGAL515B_01]WON75539.1 conjugative relaxase [Serratia sp. UGAL515B_01]